MTKLTAAEQSAIEKLARSRTASARDVERAPIILRARRGTRVPAMAKERDVTEITVRTWLTRFKAAGLAGVQEQPRSGRSVTSQPA